VTTTLLFIKINPAEAKLARLGHTNSKSPCCIMTIDAQNTPATKNRTADNCENLGIFPMTNFAALTKVESLLI
jgi:hypothetical protein